MVFTKHLDELMFQDIENLKENEIPENDILDYKKALIDDKKLVKHVSAFANTKGGYIVFGIEETGRGGYPKSIPGIDKDKINKERIEQVLISNIHPRLHVKFSDLIDIPDSTNKSILVLQIPHSHLKPHLNNISGKFHKRHNFTSIDMSEIEISDAYKRRFETYKELDEEIGKIKRALGGPIRISGQIIIIPTILTRDFIDTYNEEELSWIDPGRFTPKPQIQGFETKYGNYISKIPAPSSKGIKWTRSTMFFEVHRTGAIDYIADYGFNDNKRLNYQKLVVRLLHTLDFARELYFRYNYFGNVKVILNLADMFGTFLNTDGYDDDKLYEEKKVTIEREIPTTLLETDPMYVARNISNELFNCYQEWSCWLFDENGDLELDKLKQLD